jgi:hypothetical protein
MKQIIDTLVSVVFVLIVWGFYYILGLDVGWDSGQLISTLTVGQFVDYLFAWVIHAWAALRIMAGHKKS